MNTKTQLVELIRGIEAVVTNEGTMKAIGTKREAGPAGLRPWPSAGRGS